jgi:high-affinity iron transporter
MILVMALGVLRMDRAKAKWRVKIRRAFEGNARDRGSRAGRWALVILPFITVLREGRLLCAICSMSVYSPNG